MCDISHAYGLQASQINQAYAGGYTRGQQWAEMNQHSLNQSYVGACALGQQWSELAQQQREIAGLAKCAAAYDDHIDNALRFEQYAQESFNRIKPYKPAIDYLAITREVCGG